MRRALAVLAVALALPALVHAAANPVLASVERTSSAKSSTFRMAITTRSAGQIIRMSGSGAQTRDSARISMRIGGPAAMRFDAVLLEERGAYVMYLRSPTFSANLPRGKTWLRVDLSKEGSKLGIDFSSLLGAAQTFAPLEKGLVSTKRIGSETAAGLRTTRYRVVVDVRRVARGVPGYGQQLAALERAAGITLRRLRYDLWIAGDGRVHQIRYSVPLQVAGLRGSVAQTMTFLTFDQPVHISAPPASQVFRP